MSAGMGMDPGSMPSMFPNDLSADEKRKLTGIALPKGPEFIDTGACKCALRRYNAAKVAWRCQGNRTAETTTGSTGKWFYVEGADKDKSLDPSKLTAADAQYKPDNGTALFGTDSGNSVILQNYDPKTNDNKTVNMFDQECSGANETTQTARFYSALNQIDAGEAPTNASSCNFVPLAAFPIQNISSWQQKGCYPGFYCQYNSINARAEYCYPVPQCQQARLAGGQCPVAMGLYEPILCPQGFWCPAGGKQKLVCPAGSYCPPGTFMEPLPCTGGASCPEGSYYNQPIAPVVLLLIWNIGLTIAFFVFRAIRNKKMHRNQHSGGMMSYLSKVNPTSYLQPAAARRRAHSNASSISGMSEDDIELESNITSLKTVDAGYLTADTEYYGMSAGPSNENAPPQGELEMFVASLSRCIQGSTFGLSFSFKGLVYQPPRVSKPILNDVTGSIKAGTLVGIMGGSGAGKSTFVNVLMGKRAHTGGETKVNGVSGQIKAYKKIIGYVPQDDILLHELTVRENVLHSARIRLPSNWSDSDIQRHVDVLLQCLKLDHVKDNIVGSPGSPGVSGGQRKRVSIGMELAAAPMALFLDEPTSGLDATAASSIMELLKALSRLGITIVTIIHQPRQEIYESLDELILLGKGRMIFCGATPTCQPYFEGCGFKFPRSMNPADVLMDVINGEGRHYKRVGEVGIDALIEHWHNHSSSISEVPTIVPPQDEITALRRSVRRRGAPWWKQIYLCFLRAMVQQYRAASSFWFEMGVATLAGLLIGLASNSQHGLNYRGLYYDEYSILSSSADTNSIGQLALLCVIAIGLISASPGVKVFGEEKLVFYREAAAGHNRFAYYIGKVLSTLPRIFLAAVHFTTLFMLLSTPRMGWMTAFAIFLLYFYSIYGLSSCVSMVARREDGPLLAVMGSLIVGTLSGMAPTLKDVNSWHLGWLWRLSPGTWASEALFDKNVGIWSDIYNVQQSAEFVGYNMNAYALDLVVLIAIGTGYRVLAFAMMRLFNRSKQR